MIIAHIPVLMAEPALAIVDKTACTHEAAQLLTKEMYDFMRPDLDRSRLVHHVIVTNADIVTCADCVDIISNERNN